MFLFQKYSNFCVRGHEGEEKTERGKAACTKNKMVARERNRLHSYVCVRVVCVCVSVCVCECVVSVVRVCE